MAKQSAKKRRNSLTRKKITHPAVGTAVSADDYNAVVKCAQLRTIVLNESHFKVSPEYLVDEKSNRTFNYGHDLKYISHRVEGVSTKLMEEDFGVVAANISWNIKVRVGRKVALKIDATYTVVYAGMKGSPMEAVMLFMEKVAPVATYAYFRAHVSQLNWAADINMPILPVYNSHQ